MATHLCAYFESVDSATVTNIDTVVDTILTRPAADRFQVPIDYRSIAWAAALGVNITRAVIQTPSLAVRRETMEVLPRVRGDDLFTLDRMEVFKPKKDLVLEGTENMTFQAAEDGVGATTVYGLVALKAPGELPAVPEGDIRRVRCTATTTLTANAWTVGTITPDLDLEPGQYALVGMYGMSATGIAMRAVITGQNYRPGVPMLTTTEGAGADFNAPAYDQVLGYKMGEFAHTNIPQIEWLASAADTAETVFLDVIRIGNASGQA